MIYDNNNNIMVDGNLGDLFKQKYNDRSLTLFGDNSNNILLPQNGIIMVLYMIDNRTIAVLYKEKILRIVFNQNFYRDFKNYFEKIEI